MAQNKAKMISLEEGGFALFLVLLAFACIIVAGKTFDQVMAFHAGIGALFAAVSVFLIFKNYFDDGGEPIPAEIDGKPNYNIGPIKFGAVAAMFWGIAGFTVGLIIALQLAWPALNFDLPWTNFGRLRPLHTSAVIFASAATCFWQRRCMLSSAPAVSGCRARSCPGS
ncbi:cytochrome-c oxidase [Roseibium aggregatum IAM 12614]|uniref:Cytochrome-c oxidase n=1 Tax=Roseibium aggregatum (strain ATCC 25650 / DSM 13394 / JCM 20685 / NBRC 16684 / NCIMB 2208 / IAM 12614 / B1) TaxID=384765 RepID=A0NRD7_ROSAI|nr:cytochrome-c oxidase [Roseibium aggregatum IAM 12614]